MCELAPTTFNDNTVIDGCDLSLLLIIYTTHESRNNKATECGSGTRCQNDAQRNVWIKVKEGQTEKGMNYIMCNGRNVGL